MEIHNIPNETGMLKQPNSIQMKIRITSYQFGKTRNYVYPTSSRLVVEFRVPQGFNRRVLLFVPRLLATIRRPQITDHN